MTELPRLTRRTPKPTAGIVHIGPGAFFRAFSASFTDDVLRKTGGDWGIVAVSMRSDRAQIELEPQQGAFTSISLAPEGTTTKIIEAVTDVHVLASAPETVLQVLASEAIKIVTLTITEKGYYQAPATGELMLDAQDIQADLAHHAAPRTMPGLLVEALARRRQKGLPPFTVLSCDNLPANGRTARSVILQFASARDAALAQWIETEGRFPSSMVDRITPATTQDVVADLAAKTGYLDLGCVQHEPFRQWVIEDDFVAGERPAWEHAGAQFVQSVEAHEAMKLRCLNGTHSTLAYLGYLAGHETIAEATSDALFANLCQKLWRDDILPTLKIPEGEDLDAYVDALLARYQNPAIRHRLWQIAMDGSQKLPQRILATIADRLDQGETPRGLYLSVAAWMRYVGAVDEQGRDIDVRDPLAETLRAVHARSDTPEQVVTGILAIDAIFPVSLAKNIRFQEGIATAYKALVANGARQSVAAYLEEKLG